MSSSSRRPAIQSVKIRSALTCEMQDRRLRRLLRARSRPRHARQHGRGRRRHRGAVDRRAGHAAHHAHLPHRRHGAGGRPVVPGSVLRGHGPDPQPQRGARTRTAVWWRWAATWRSSSSTRAARSAPRTASPTAARIFVDDGDKVRRGQRIAEWDPYTRPILTELDGIGGVRGSRRGCLGLRAGRRGDGHHQARRHRLAGQPARPGPQAGHRHQGQERQGRQARARQRRPLLPLGRRHPVGRAGRDGPGRRRARRVFRWKAPRPRTSPAVCRASPNCSRPVVRRTTRSSPRSTAR